MKIAIPVVGFSRAGGERVLSRIATELIIRGHDVYFVAPDNGSEPYYPTSATIYRSFKETKYNKVVNYLITYYKIFKKCAELKPDLVLANYNLTAYIAYFLPKKIIKVYYIQAYETLLSQSRLRKLIAYLTYSLPLNKIVNNENILPEKINDYIDVIPAGVDTQVFSSRNKMNSRHSIGIIGRKEKHKGTSELIDVLIDWIPGKDCILNIGVYLDERDAHRLEQAGVRYNHIPINNDSALADFYRSNDLMIATGLVEDGAFHYPCAEAMACGCLVISNYAPLVNTDSVLKIKQFSKELIREKLDVFYNLVPAQIQHEIEGNNIIDKIYSWDIVGDKFDKVLVEIKKKSDGNK
ncbi:MULTISPECIES: glycosyltransferase family 4 protein [Lelliottia]|jgi:hypothetical protein|uniref:Glycosyltransferase subfamily 4-like N-terminal domain-containing protein n=1 Tax=Lelliottia aquatilis TaxID=2080838 RepID=A0ABX4ZZG2_9ENTR|nr:MULTISPECIES: glycosyltransferase family 4 protein [Lelliottia]MBL5882995.1 glycosyltransferase family 4 protein [Lelliottia aquatilis]NTZ44563.1 glycosyltransferase family 4 protein [Lelliottia aquatilis]POZ18314.1 hypothetical protein C3708_17625 [Lelliottia sp. 7254-16]POZ21753.1 hypothetical protein C3712_14990 [Lelliottia aquatilis]POZ23885.1 hypothetical protein C3711_15735 [Lelliottia aquatilis]